MRSYQMVALAALMIPCIGSMLPQGKWLPASAAHAEEWTGWRGPRGDGSSQETQLPVMWSPDKNIRWKTALNGAGHSSPVVCGGRVFVTYCQEAATEGGLCPRLLGCFDARTGNLLWEETVVDSPLEGKHSLNSYASGTPAADAEAVYVAFLDREEMVVSAYDFNGKLVWSVRPGEFHSRHGFCSCPVLFEDLVIVNGDHDGDGYLVALDRSTGVQRWKVARPNHTRSYVTPIIRQMAGKTQMVMSGSKCVTSYDPTTGKQLWYLAGPTEQFVASLVDNGEHLFLTAGYPELHILSLRADGQGELTDDAIVWRTTEGASYVPSPLIVGDYLLVVSDSGICSCFEAATGDRLWKERVGTKVSSSPISAGGLAYFTNEDGQTTVIRPGPDFEKVAANDLGAACYASPAASDGAIFFRTEGHLICVAETP